MNRRFLIMAAALIALAAAGGYLIGYDIGYEKAAKVGIDSFEDCAAAGYPVMESFPEQCTVPGGKTFTKSY